MTEAHDTVIDGGTPLRVVVAPMRDRDLDAVLPIERAVFPDPWSRRLFREELAQRRSRMYRVAWIDTDVVGFGGLMVVDDEAHVNNVAVRPDWQGHRIGTALLCVLIRTAIDRGLRHLTLEVRVGNRPALALYERFGLAPVGVRPGYYQQGEDALIMWAHDIDGQAYNARLTSIEESFHPSIEVTAVS